MSNLTPHHHRSHLTLTSSLTLLTAFTVHLLLLSCTVPSTDGVVASGPELTTEGRRRLLGRSEEYSKFDPNEIALMKRKAKCFQVGLKTRIRALAQEKEPETEEYKKLCGDLMTNFCSHVQCEPIKSCPRDQVLVENLVGHSCCPACVKFLPDGAQCTQGSVLEQCDNGLDCSPSKGVCDIPREQKACLTDYHNRMMFRARAARGTGFWVPAEIGPKHMVIHYHDEMEVPSCSAKSGDYEIKQRSRNKAYCVNPDTGIATFGLADFSKAENATCKCSAAMFDQLSRLENVKMVGSMAKEKALDELDKKITNHFADTHIKCTQTGDFHEMQCINETCLCVNEYTGVPLTTIDDFIIYKQRLDDIEEANKPEDSDLKKKLDRMTPDEREQFEEEEEKKKAEERKKRDSRLPTREVNSSATAIFGAFRSLLCFDNKRAKKVNSNFSKSVYIEDCVDQIHTSMTMQRHFTLKGSLVKGLESKTCGYDDKFTRKQCLPDSCRCSDPDGSSIGAYSVELSKAENMDCRCAIEEHFVTVEKLAFDRIGCEGDGNFAPLQCIGGRYCYCADQNGAAISKEFSFECVNRFMKKHSPGFTLQLVCSAMRATLSNERVWHDTEEMYYDIPMKSYTWKSGKPLKSNTFDPWKDAC